MDFPLCAVDLVYVDRDPHVGFHAITASGNVYFSSNAMSWVFAGNLFGGTVSVQPETWTGVKEKYRK